MEDGVWTPQVLERCKKMVIIHDALYHYCIHEGSVSRRRRRTEREVVGYYKNLLERDEFILDYITKGYDEKQLRKVVTDLETVYKSCCNLNLWGVKEIAKSIVLKYSKALQGACWKKTQQKLLSIIFSSETFENDKKYHKFLILSPRIGITEKIELLRNKCISRYRRFLEKK